MTEMFDLAQRWCQVFLKLEISFAHLVFVATDNRWLVDDTLLLLSVPFFLHNSVAFGAHFFRFFHAVSVVTNQSLHDIHLVINKFVSFRHGCFLYSFSMRSLAVSILFCLSLNTVGLVNTFGIRITNVDSVFV